MNLSIRLNDKEAELIRNYALAKGMTVSALVRQTVLERIEDEHDLVAYEKGIQEYQSDPAVYTLEEVETELNKPQNNEPQIGSNMQYTAKSGHCFGVDCAFNNILP